MKLNKLIYILITFIYFSCNTNDDIEQNNNDISLASPDFSVNISPLFETAEVNLIIPDGENNQNLFFDVFLDDELIITDAIETEYFLENLNENSNYELKVIAKNTDAETTVNNSFLTLNLENYNFLLDTFSYLDKTYQYEYNELNQLISRTIDNEFEEDFFYQYGADGNLLEERLLGYSYLSKATFNYQNGILVGFNSIFSSADDYNFTFQDQDNYSYSIIPDIDPTGNYNFEVQLQRVDNKIVSYERTRLETNEVIGKLQFSYENGNVNSIIDELNNKTWTFEYDDKNNYGIKLGYFTKRGPGVPSGFGGTSLYFDFLSIPDFTNYSNRNNVTKVYENGQLILDYTYEYYIYDYPSKIFINGNSEPRELTYIFRSN